MVRDNGAWYWCVRMISISLVLVGRLVTRDFGPNSQPRNDELTHSWMDSLNISCNRLTSNLIIRIRVYIQVRFVIFDHEGKFALNGLRCMMCVHLCTCVHSHNGVLINHVYTCMYICWFFIIDILMCKSNCYDVDVSLIFVKPWCYLHYSAGYQNAQTGINTVLDCVVLSFVL